MSVQAAVSLAEYLETIGEWSDVVYRACGPEPGPTVDGVRRGRVSKQGGDRMERP